MDTGMTPYSGSDLSEAVEEIAEAIVVIASLAQSFGQMRGFESSTGRLDIRRMLDWLVEIERENGRVDETTMSEEGRSWLLTKALGQTLDEATRSIARITSSSQFLANMRDANGLRSVLMAQNLNVANQFYGVFSDQDKTEEMMGNRR